MTITPSVPATGPASSAFLAVTKVLPPKGLNTSIYLDLNNFSRHTAWAHGFMHAYALWLGLVVLTVLFVVGYGIVGRAAAELRPYHTYTHALVLVAKANDYAFPSDHALVAGGLITSIFLATRATSLRLGAPAPNGLCPSF